MSDVEGQYLVAVLAVPVSETRFQRLFDWFDLYTDVESAREHMRGAADQAPS